MPSPSEVGIIYYSILVLSVIFFVITITKSLKVTNASDKSKNIFISTGKKPLLYLAENKNIAINTTLIKTIYAKENNIYAELCNEDTFIIKECSNIDDHQIKIEIENIVESINNLKESEFTNP